LSDRPYVFLDDGGVISDSHARAGQWERLVGEFFAPRLGGSPEAWGVANHEVMRRSWREGGFGGFDVYYAQVAGLHDEAFEADLDAHLNAWLRTMCQLVGVPIPSDAVALANAACTFVTERVRAPFPDVVEAVQDLAGRGYALHTASGERSLELDGYLRALGIRQLFADRLFGADLARIPKAGPEFYSRMFDSLGISASDAVIVDDSPIALAWAAQEGAETILIDRDARHAHAGRSIASLHELPNLLP
jgi:HAD superfamily hydrolase (TIGR01509 family)